MVAEFLLLKAMSRLLKLRLQRISKIMDALLVCVIIPMGFIVLNRLQLLASDDFYPHDLLLTPFIFLLWRVASYFLGNLCSLIGICSIDKPGNHNFDLFLYILAGGSSGNQCLYRGLTVYISPLHTPPMAGSGIVVVVVVLPDGSVLRAQLPGRPSLDCLFADPARDGISLLKIWNVNKCTGVVGVFNCQGAGWCKIQKKTRIHDASPVILTGSVQ